MNDTNTIKERPILYSGAMVRARMEGRKTQTRRVVKPQNGDHFAGCLYFSQDIEQIESQCPYGKPGDRLWVRERHQLRDVSPRGWPQCLIGYADGTVLIVDPAEGDRPRPREECEMVEIGHNRWRPSIHMPRWASRGLDEITAIRVERLQDISEADAIAEGIEIIDRDACLFRHYGEPFAQSTNDDPRQGMAITAEESFETLWESINGPASWEANPWVWVIEFKVLS